MVLGFSMFKYLPGNEARHVFSATHESVTVPVERKENPDRAKGHSDCRIMF